jgi:hypothetical protein
MGLAAPSFPILDREIAAGPALTPATHLPSGEANLLSHRVIAQMRLLMKEQYQTAALHVLPTRRAFPGCLASLLQKILRKVTRRWFGSTHLLPPCESDFWLLSASIPKLRGNPDIICEMDH